MRETFDHVFYRIRATYAQIARPSRCSPRRIVVHGAVKSCTITLGQIRL